MFKTFNLDQDHVTDLTTDPITISITASSGYDVQYSRVSVSSLTGIYNNIKATFYNSYGATALTSFYDSSTTNSVAVLALSGTLLYDGLSAVSTSGVGTIRFTLKDGTANITIIDYQDDTTLQTRTNAEYYGKLIDSSTSASSKLVYGEVFYNYGLMVLHGFGSNNTLSSNLKNTTSTVTYNAAPAGSNIGFSSISGYGVQKQAQDVFFVRAYNKEFNYSNNPTFADQYGVIQSSLTSDPKTYITTVGMYNSKNELLAQAKLSQPYEKNFQNELALKVILRY